MYRERDYPISIPTWEAGEWIEDTIFETQVQFIEYLKNLFKEPGKYEFDESVVHWQDQSMNYNKIGYYCQHPTGTRDFIQYWNDQKNKSRIGVIYKSGSRQWYLTRDYYFWLNFLPIFDKEKNEYDFPLIWDIQYHMALYELLAELNNKHSVILKKRQIASSYFHCAKLTNYYWFEEGAKLKMGASLKDYINLKGSWKMLNEYSDFLNEHTAWIRPHNPGKVGDWEQKIQKTIGGRDITVGLKSTMSSYTFEKDATSGVGGPCRYFFHEEAGVAPKMDETYEFMRPALHSGMITTGMFIAAGSVGDLDQCEPLKEFMLHPEENDFFAVESNLIDEEGTWGKHGLFLPEQWSMPPYIDEFGNSMVEEALKAIHEQRLKWKKDLDPGKYQLRISQKPTNIREAFAYRNESKFPLHLLTNQQRRIEDKQYHEEHINLKRGTDGKSIIVTKSNKTPIREFPIRKSETDKEGVIVVWERPVVNPEFGMYYGSIDPVAEGKAEYIENNIYTPKGKVKIKDLKVGDKVIGSNGKPTLITGIFPQGKKELYRVTFNDGFSILVCKEHLWSVRASDNDKKDNHVLSVGDMLDENKLIKSHGINRNSTKEYTTKTFYKKGNNQNRWKIPIVKPIHFKKTSLPIDSYLLGLLLGDGGLSGRSIVFSTADKELLRYIRNILPETINIKYIGQYDYRLSSTLSRNTLTQKLRKLNLVGKKSGTKFIPDIYLKGTIEDRLKLIQGLMDTDGYCGNNGAEYYSISKDLAYGMVELCHSLGGLAKIRKKITNRKKRNGVGYVYVVRVILPPQFIPFKLKRKADIYKPTKNFTRYISNIEFEKIDEAICISVEAEDNLYVTENAIVTHNTTTSDSLCSIYIYKNTVEISKPDENGNMKTHVEGGKIVATWCGRFDDINLTHERLELLIEWYNAWTVVENNISLFIQHMIAQRKQKYLVPKDQILFLKNVGANKAVYQDYGWRNTGTLFKNHMISYAIEFLKEKMDIQYNDNGELLGIVYGVERIPDIMLLKEMSEYRDGLNVDRLVAFAALVAFVRIQESNKGYKRVVEYEDTKSLEKSKKMFKLSKSPFTNIGTTKKGFGKRSRSGFKNIH